MQSVDSRIMQHRKPDVYIQISTNITMSPQREIFKFRLIRNITAVIRDACQVVIMEVKILQTIHNPMKYFFGWFDDFQFPLQGLHDALSCTYLNSIMDYPSVSKTHLGWGLLSQFSPFRYFPHLPLLSKQTLGIEYHVYIWQVSPQLSCGETCQIWMWFRESNRYFCKIENFAYGEISERSFSNPHPW